MSMRLYEDHLPIKIEYFIGNAKNKVEFLREAEEVAREKTAIEVIFKYAIQGILKVSDKFEKPLDMSKGDIRRVVGSKELLATINKLSKDYNLDAKDIQSSPVSTWGLDEFVVLARKSYLYISNLTSEFTKAFQDSNLIIMNYYKALVSNLFALVGECVAYSISGEKVDYQSLRVSTLKNFIESYEKESIYKFFETSRTLLEEVREDTPGKFLTESYDLVQSGVHLIRKLINKFDRNDYSRNIGTFAYKAVEFIKQIISLKQMIWPLVVNMLPRMNEYITLFKGFLDSAETRANMGQTTKIANQIITNSVRADDKANYLISLDNDQMYNNVQKSWQAKQSAPAEDIEGFSF